MATLTVFTPTFNRAHILSKGYEALLQQTCKDFEWLIIDDGSTDHTRTLVMDWIAENKLTIRYHYQPNQGVHIAHNTAYQLIDSELNVCIDSDDYMPHNAIENILSLWKKEGSEQYAGIIGYSQTFQGKIIGKKLPDNQKTTTTLDYFHKQGGKGDKILVYRTALLKKYPCYPQFEGEKFMGLTYISMLIDQDYPLLILNEPLSAKEYLPNGISRNIYQTYWNNPRGYIFFRITEMKTTPTFLRRYMVCIHYISSCIRAKDSQWLTRSPYKFLTIMAIPFGFMLYALIRYKVKHHKHYTINW